MLTASRRPLKLVMLFIYHLYGSIMFDSHMDVLLVIVGFQLLFRCLGFSQCFQTCCFYSLSGYLITVSGKMYFEATVLGRRFYDNI